MTYQEFADQHNMGIFYQTIFQPEPYKSEVNILLKKKISETNTAIIKINHLDGEMFVTSYDSDNKPLAIGAVLFIQLLQLTVN